MFSGPITGRCIESDVPGKGKTCEIFGWCPVEQDQRYAEDWTLKAFTVWLMLFFKERKELSFEKYNDH